MYQRILRGFAWERLTDATSPYCICRKTLETPFFLWHHVSLGHPGEANILMSFQMWYRRDFFFSRANSFMSDTGRSLYFRMNNMSSDNE